MPTIPRIINRLHFAAICAISMMVPSLDVVLDVVWPFLLRMTDSYVLWFAFLIMVVYFRQLMNRFAHASVRVISVMIGGDKSRQRA